MRPPSCRPPPPWRSCGPPCAPTPAPSLPRTLANPSLAIADLEVFAQAAHEQGVPLIVDNTFPTPINCRPIEFGADIVTHSTTKYMDGHAVQVGGVIVDSGNFNWDNGKFPMLTQPTSPITAWCTPSSLARRLTSPRPAPT